MSASIPLSNDEAKDLLRRLGISEDAKQQELHSSKKDSSKNSGESSIASLLSELYRSDIGRWPPHSSRKGRR